MRPISLRFLALISGGLLVAVIGPGRLASGQAAGDAPKPLPAEVRAAWEAGGAQSGWISTDNLGWLSFRAGDGKGQGLEVPAFLFRPQHAVVPAKLPAPDQEFGLDLKDTDITDAGLRGLARFKQLKALNVFGTRVTGAGLRELAP